MASISVSTQLSTGSTIKLANENMDRSTSEVWTGQHQNRIFPIGRCPAKASLLTWFFSWRWELDGRLFTYLQNIILQGCFQMYTVPFGTSPIVGAPRCWTSVPRRLDKSRSIQRDKHCRLVMWYTRSASHQGDNCVSHLCIRQYSHEEFFGCVYTLPLYFKIGNVWNDIRLIPQKYFWILIGLIPCHPKGAKNTDKVWHYMVGIVLSPLKNLDITGPGLTWNCADGFQRQCYPLLAAWVRDNPEQVMVPQVLYGLCPMCEIPKGALMGHSTFRPLNNPRDQFVYLELPDKTNIHVLHTLGVHPIWNQFWQYSLCNVYRLWQPDELHQLLLGLVKDLLRWQLKYLKARNVKNQFDNWFTSVPQYLGLQCFHKRFDWMNSSSWEGKQIWCMIRTLAVLQFLPAPRMTGKLWSKQHLMKW